MDKGNSVLATYLELTKAFDTVYFKILLHKLKHYGIICLANKWFYSYLTDRKQFTKINEINSDKQSISTGIPQGSVHGPLLFLLYMNDIAMCEKDYQLRLFADDTSLYLVATFMKPLKHHRIVLKTSQISHYTLIIIKLIMSNQ